MERVTSIIAAFTMLFAPQSYTAVAATSAALPVDEARIVCIDPGHGGYDPGATNGDLTEAEVNLNIAKRLKKLLEDNGYKVIMTRSDNDTGLTNTERADICNKNNADLLISIHLNSSADSTMDYTQNLYGVATKDKKFAGIINQELQSSLVTPLPPEEAVTDFNSNMLLKAEMPATLAETIFLSSPDEYARLITGVRQQQIADALYSGIKKWFTT